MKNYMCLFSLLCGCANIVPPSGGEKDTLPPILIDAHPPNLSVNFNASKIDLLFNEYINIRGADNIRLSPECDTPPKILQKGKKIEISLSCSLDSNTTYTLNFGNSIVDLHENNAAKNLKYVFSTGETLDSLLIKGSVSELYFNERAPNCLVYLALISDTLQMPYYYTFTDDKGDFVFENIKDNNYIIHAIGDDNNNLQYDSGELVSMPELIESFNNYKQIGLFYEQGPAIQEVVNKYKNVIYFLHEPWADSIKVLNTAGVWNNNDNVSSFWFTDSLDYIHYVYGNNPDSVLIYNNESPPKIQLTLHSKPHNIARTNNIILKSNQPMKKIFKNLFSWSSNNNPVVPKLVDPFTIQIPCNLDTLASSTLILKQSAVSSFSDEKNDSIAFSLDLNKEKFGSLNIKSNNNEAFNMVELFNEKGVVQKINLKDTQSIKWIKPGSYQLRIYSDINHNNNWDSANLLKSLQNEKIKIYPELIKIRANWEIEVTIQVPI